jgi:hypothetical protein
MSLVKYRQSMLVTGRKISQLERSLASYGTKNAELDAKILSLGSSQSLSKFIEEHSLVSMNARNTVRIPVEEANLHGRMAGVDNFSQTN